MTLPFVDLRRQYSSLKAEIDQALVDSAASTQYILGEELTRFEEEYAAYCGTRYCVGVGSGTAAIQLALEALGIGPGDEVIVPANTFIGSVLPVLRLGASPVLVDCDEVTSDGRHRPRRRRDRASHESGDRRPPLRARG